MASVTPNPPVLLTVQQAAERLNVPRTAAYVLIASKRLSSIKIGRLRRVPAAAIDEFIARQLADQGE